MKKTAKFFYRMRFALALVLLPPFCAAQVKISGGSGGYVKIGASNGITLTTTGTSGPATLTGSILNIPNYTQVYPAAGLGLSTGSAWTAFSPTQCPSGQAPTGIDANGNATGCQAVGGGSGGGILPSTAAVEVITFSGVDDDGRSLAPAVPLSSGSCNGTTCDLVFSSAHNMVVGNYIYVGDLTGWPPVPTGLYGYDTGVGVFKVASVISSTELTFAYGTAATLTGGSAYNADYWGSYQVASQPFMSGGAKYQYRFSTLADLDTYFSTKVNCALGSPTYLVLQVGQNDLSGAGTPIATMESHFQSVWQKAHTAGCKVVQETISAADYGIQITPAGLLEATQLNAWILNQVWASSTVSSGQYADYLIDWASNNYDITSTPNPLGFRYQHDFATRINDKFMSQGDSVTGPPPLFYMWSSGAMNRGIMGLPLNWHFVDQNGNDDLTVLASTSAVVIGNGLQLTNIHASSGTQPLTADTAGNVAVGNFPTWTAAGDLSGNSSSQQVIGLKSVPFCTGYTPANGDIISYTTGSSPNPCYTAQAAPSGSFSAGGDLSGTSTSQEVTGLLTHALPSLTAGCLNWTGSAWSIAPCTGGGSGTKFLDTPLDAVPGTANAMDDEFTGESSLPVKWTVVANGSMTTQFLNSQILYMAQPVHSGNNVASIYQTAPATPWTVVTKIFPHLEFLNYRRIGIVMNDGTSTGKIITFTLTEQSGTSGNGVDVYDWSSPTSPNASVCTRAGIINSPFIYLSAQDDGTNLNFKYSIDGLTYETLCSVSRTAWFTSGPAGVGIGIDASAGDGTSGAAAGLGWFRRTQ